MAILGLVNTTAITQAIDIQVIGFTHKCFFFAKLFHKYVGASVGFFKCVYTNYLIEQKVIYHIFFRHVFVCITLMAMDIFQREKKCFKIPNVMLADVLRSTGRRKRRIRLWGTCNVNILKIYQTQQTSPTYQKFF